MNNQNNQNKQWKLLVFLLKEIAEQKGITHQQIANKTGLLRSNVTRFFMAKYTPRLDVFLEIAKSCEANIYIEDKEGTSELNIAFEKAMEELGRRPDRLPKN